MAAKAMQPATLAVVQAITPLARGPMVVAVSGGADSLALAAGAQLVAKHAALPLRAVIIDHQLQDESAQVAQKTVVTLERLGICSEVITVQVTPTGSGLEAAARQARYSALENNAEAGEVVLLGHTLDDQAETVLLGLARGSGTRSLAGMPATRGCFRRPLLGVRRTTTRQMCQEIGITWWDDPQNLQSRFSRVRVRESLLPQMENLLGAGVSEALARTASLAAIDADYLDELAKQCWANSPDAVSETLGCAWLVQLPMALRSRILRGWLLEQGATEVFAVHLAAVEALVSQWHGQKWVDIPGLRVFRRAGRLNASPQFASR